MGNLFASPCAGEEVGRLFDSEYCRLVGYAQEKRERASIDLRRALEEGGNFRFKSWEDVIMYHETPFCMSTPLYERQKNKHLAAIMNWKGPQEHFSEAKTHFGTMFRFCVVQQIW